jgi:outer membrane protein assembly factor BamB
MISCRGNIISRFARFGKLDAAGDAVAMQQTRLSTATFTLSSKKWPMFSSASIAGDTLYIGTHAGKLMAVDLKTQKMAWEFETEGSKTNGGQFTKADDTPNI